MAKSVLFPCYFKTKEAGKRSGVDFRRQMDIWQLFDWSYQYKVQINISVTEVIITSLG